MSNLCPHIQTIYDNESRTHRCATCGVHTADGALDHTLNAQGESAAKPHSQLYDDVREYATLAAQEVYTRTELHRVEANLAKVKSRLAEAAGDGPRYLRAGYPAIVRVSNVPGQGVKIGLIAVEDIQ